MPYIFKCRDAADLMMLAPAADQLLDLIGKTPAPQGTVTVAALPAAILALETALARQAADASAQNRREDMPDDAPTDDEPVTLRQMAWPLLSLFKQALRAQQPVVWDT